MCTLAKMLFTLFNKWHRLMGVGGHREAQTIKFINWGTEGGVCVGRRGGGEGGGVIGRQFETRATN